MRHCHVMSTSLKSWHEHRGLWHSGDIEYSTIKIYLLIVWFCRGLNWQSLAKNTGATTNDNYPLWHENSIMGRSNLKENRRQLRSHRLLLNCFKFFHRSIVDTKHHHNSRHLLSIHFRQTFENIFHKIFLREFLIRITI